VSKGRKMSQNQRKKLRKDLFAWNDCCHWCGEKMILKAKGYDHKNPHPDFATIEHLDQLCDGGDEFDIANIVLSHLRHNK